MPEEDTIGSFRSGRADGTLGRVEVGIRVRLHGSDGEDVGVAHAPGPVVAGDVVALADGSAWRVMSVIAVYNAGDFAALCMVEPAHMV